MSDNKVGGIAAVLEALLYIIGIAFLSLVITPAISEFTTDAEKLAYILHNKTLFQTWNLLIYVVFGILLVPLTIVINKQFSETSLIGSKVTPIFGFIWAGMVIASGMINNVGLNSIETLFVSKPESAIASWKTINAIQNGLGGGVEVVGGLWVLLISIVGLKQAVFSKSIHYLGLLVGITGVLTAVPGLSDLGMVFGLTQIIWFGWLGVVLILKKDDKQPLSKTHLLNRV